MRKYIQGLAVGIAITSCCFLLIDFNRYPHAPIDSQAESSVFEKAPNENVTHDLSSDALARLENQDSPSAHTLLNIDSQSKQSDGLDSRKEVSKYTVADFSTGFEDESKPTPPRDFDSYKLDKVMQEAIDISDSQVRGLQKIIGFSEERANELKANLTTARYRYRTTEPFTNIYEIVEESLTPEEMRILLEYHNSNQSSHTTPASAPR